MMESNIKKFPRTRWTLVDRAATISSDAGFNALNQLLTRYRPALKAHLLAVRKLPDHRADDLIQAFVPVGEGN
ncbi:MAG: hypothetical protein AAF492_31305 [Verrucomicrobiota bacterium]